MGNGSVNPLWRPYILVPVIVLSVIIVFGMGWAIGNVFGGMSSAPNVANDEMASGSRERVEQSGGGGQSASASVMSGDEGRSRQSAGNDGSGSGESGFKNVATNPEQSACGLKGEVLERATLTEAPPVDEWRYQDAIAYPYSPEFGPAAENGPVRYCFQHSPEGALYAVANGFVQGNDQSSAGKWIRYAFAEGPVKDEIVSNDHPDEGRDVDVFRIEIQGFRMLSYAGDKASVDLALSLEKDGKTAYLSIIYNVVWEGNDWKVHITDINKMFDVSYVSHLDGYILWSPDL
ncbi:MAG: hypothetical protein Q4C87_01975 [Actinomycetaceae bacterium]|nr:hypothetical protein [Actinomycetaceae bacterium]